MGISSNWAFPDAIRPRPDQVPFDLESAVQSVVLVHAEIPENGLTAHLLNTDRNGSGIVIDGNGLVLTISYLVAEARSVWLTTHDGKVVPGDVVAHDPLYGFGLIMPLGRLGVPALPRGSSRSVRIDDNVIILGQGGLHHSLNAHVTDRREFAGYWEYILEDAIFTAPAHPQLGGTALLGQDGRLLGVGSRLVEESADGEKYDANMFVPIDHLEPIFDELVRYGRSTAPPRPWLGIYVTEQDGDLVIGGLAPDGPAHRAGLRPGDRILQVKGHTVNGLADLFRRTWAAGPAGSQLPLTLARGGKSLNVRLQTADRQDYLVKPQRH